MPVLQTAPVQRFSGYTTDYFPEEYAQGVRAQAWHWLLRDFWTKIEAIAFARAQIEGANRLAAYPHLQDKLEDVQLEAIAELSRFYKGDCDVAAFLAAVPVHPYVLWRLHDWWLHKFLACPVIVLVLARRLAGEPFPAPPPGGRAISFPISAASLFRAITPYLHTHPELWDLLERSAVEHVDEFEDKHVKPLIDAFRDDPCVPALLHAMCARMPTQPTRTNLEFGNEKLRNIYLPIRSYAWVQMSTIGARILLCLRHIAQFPPFPLPSQSACLRRLPQVPVPPLYRNGSEYAAGRLKNLAHRPAGHTCWRER
jgi:hypothetical protein